MADVESRGGMKIKLDPADSRLSAHREGEGDSSRLKVAISPSLRGNNRLNNFGDEQVVLDLPSNAKVNIERSIPETSFKKIARRSRRVADVVSGPLGLLAIAGYSLSAAQYYAYDTSAAESSNWKRSLGGMVASSVVAGGSIVYLYMRNVKYNRSLERQEREKKEKVSIQIFPQPIENA